MKITPKELDIETLTTFRFDLETAAATYNDDPSKAFANIDLRASKKSFKLMFVGELTTNGIYAGEYGHSLGIALEDVQDEKAIEEFEDWFTLLQLPKEFDIKPVLKEGILYLKMKEKNGKYSASCDVNISPKSPEKGLERGQPVRIETDMKAYINFETKTAGFYFPIVSIKTKLEPVAKKAKKSA